MAFLAEMKRACALTDAAAIAFGEAETGRPSARIEGERGRDPTRAGGDTASASAPGCPVIVKGHSARSGIGASETNLATPTSSRAPNALLVNFNSRTAPWKKFTRV